MPYPWLRVYTGILTMQGGGENIFLGHDPAYATGRHGAGWINKKSGNLLRLSVDAQARQ